MLAATGHHKHAKQQLKRKDDRVIIHFDYDCFYASVVEAENPTLKNLPLAIQQKQIIVTCNYEARRRGLYKLQLITEAKKICPDVVIVLGEDLTRFRNASKSLYQFIRSYSWNGKVEKLGFDEVWMDVTDIVGYNADCLNPNDLSRSFFQLSRTDPIAGFPFDAARGVYGYAFPAAESERANGSVERESRVASLSSSEDLRMRLVLASHLASHIRAALEYEKGYTSTVGIATSKLLSKLVGNLHKPNGQTTLLPPYETDGHDGGRNNVYAFLDPHDVGKVPWIGFKLAQKLRQHMLGRSPDFDDGLVYGGTKENVTVGQLRMLPNLSPQLLENILSGPGSPRGIGVRVFELLHGIDNTSVADARAVPRQISIEDSYVKLDHLGQVLDELKHLSVKLVQRMIIDLTATAEAEGGNFDDNNHADAEGDNVDGGRSGEELQATTSAASVSSLRWLAFPTTLRLSTRPRLPLNADGTRERTFKRISRSCPIPTFLAKPFREADVDTLSKRLVAESLLPLFRKLHPEKSGWNLSLVNVAVTGMEEQSLAGSGAQSIGDVFRRIENASTATSTTNTMQQRLPAGGANADDDDDDSKRIISRHIHSDYTIDAHLNISSGGNGDGPIPEMAQKQKHEQAEKRDRQISATEADDDDDMWDDSAILDESESNHDRDCHNIKQQNIFIRKDAATADSDAANSDNNHTAAAAAYDNHPKDAKARDDHDDTYDDNDNEYEEVEAVGDEGIFTADMAYICSQCHERIPHFARMAHERFHSYSSSTVSHQT